MTLDEYRKKRNFDVTGEPKAKKRSSKEKKLFVIQKHRARSLHYDFRFEFSGVLKSWAIPKGLSKKSKDKRLAIQTEDHPVDYAYFEGTIPKGEYGAGTVETFDIGSYYNIKKDKSGKIVSMRTSLKDGHIEIYLEGEKFKGSYALVRFKDKQWLAVKMKEKS